MEKKNQIAQIEPKNDIKMYIVVCGGNEIRKDGHAHAAVCFDLKVAMAEKKQMEDCGYPCKGVFEIEALNIFNTVPRYLREKIS